MTSTTGHTTVSFVLAMAMSGSASAAAQDRGRAADSTSVLWANQARIHAVSDRVHDYLDSRTADDPGYAGMVVDPETTTLHLYWKGPLPSQVRETIVSAPREVSVDVRPASYSRAEMKAAVDRFIRATEAMPGYWSSVGPDETGSGITVRFAGQLSRHGDRSAGQYAVDASTLAGLPVQASQETPSVPTATRHSGGSPWYAGAEMSAPVGETGSSKFCSTGFSGWQGARPVILTAWHCGADGSYASGTGTLVGWARDSAKDLDSLVIELRDKPGSRAYIGAWNDGGATTHIYGGKTNNVGERVCTDGAMSGQHCGLQVTEVDQVRMIGGNRVTLVDTAMRTDDHTIVSANGDSGGPVLGDPVDDAWGAKGLIVGSAGDAVACRWGTDTVAGWKPTCYSGVSYVPIGAITQKFGISLA
ncbi:hypothetical protein ACIQOV_15230 [Kitasatospora sp. NPDC091257]|uniref:hypothetical protein n=1 Tax=Kitasatospora sp. NPDC091257 TaxID=3364084 RepID=UPI003811E398